MVNPRLTSIYGTQNAWNFTLILNIILKSTLNVLVLKKDRKSVGNSFEISKNRIESLFQWDSESIAQMWLIVAKVWLKYDQSMVKVWSQYGQSMAKVWLIYGLATPIPDFGKSFPYPYPKFLKISNPALRPFHQTIFNNAPKWILYWYISGHFRYFQFSLPVLEYF